MTAFDVVIALGALSALIGGFRLGFIARVASWLGLALGLVVAVRLLPSVVAALGTPPAAVALVVSLAVVAAGAFVGQAIGLLVGARLRPADEHGSVTPFDGLFGALAGVAGFLAVVWLLLPVLADTDGVVAAQVRASWTARQLDEHLPDPPDAVQTLRTLVGEDRFPEVFATLRPTPPLGPPPAASGLDPVVAQRVARSVVKVEGVACRTVQNGTGFVVADGLVATNAHVVAGESTTTVVRDDGSEIDAQVVAFDPARDLALLAAPALGRPALPVGESRVEASGGVFGHPGGEALRIAPFRVARILDATGRNIYGTGLAEREVMELAASLRPGDSGSALVAPDGSVVGVAFAVAKDRAGVAYALSTDELRAVLAAPRAGAVDTGPCLT